MALHISVHLIEITVKHTAPGTFSFSHMSRDELAQSVPWIENVPGVVFSYDGELFPGESVTERTMQSIEYIYIIIDKNICR